MNQKVSLWRQIQRGNFTSLDKLCTFLELDASNLQKLTKDSPFKLNLPRRLACKIEKNALHDPLFRQFVPLQEEKEIKPGFACDPVGDTQAALSPKYLKKYAERALLLVTSACSVHCRYCFRQHYPYETEKGFSKEIQAIHNDKTLREVILSGGDPLSLSDEELKKLIFQIAEAPHVRRLRFHTRFPIGIPERIDDSFINLLKSIPLQVFFVIHCNHPKELDADVIFALKRIQKLGIPVMNQAVLLKGVNDSKETLQELCELLAESGILFYYLHQLDKVQGAHHFEVDIKKGMALIQELTKSLSGYAVPKYVCEIPKALSKTRIL